MLLNKCLVVMETEPVERRLLQILGKRILVVFLFHECAVLCRNIHFITAVCKNIMSSVFYVSHSVTEKQCVFVQAKYFSHCTAINC
jgi:hypothetical protein